MGVTVKVKTFPVIEIFGPTIAGEGAFAGMPTHFVRFGGCDYRCSWCDSLHAVLPEQVRENATRMDEDTIAGNLRGLDGRPGWVTLSGGNPALLKLDTLIDRLHEDGFKVAVETQGSRWRDWLGTVDCLTVSPKPPSSGMATSAHYDKTLHFMLDATSATDVRFHLREPLLRCLKIVVFDEADFEWAKAFICRWPEWPPFLSVGTEQPSPEFAHLSMAHQATVDRITVSYRWLCEKVAADPLLANVRVLPQLHVLAWGHAKGV